MASHQVMNQNTRPPSLEPHGPDWDAVLFDFAHGETQEGARHDIEQHLAGCTECQQALSDALIGEETFQNCTIQPLGDISASILRRLPPATPAIPSSSTAVAASSAVTTALSEWWIPLLVVAGACCLAISGLWDGQSVAPSPTPLATPLAVTAPELGSPTLLATPPTDGLASSALASFSVHAHDAAPETVAPVPIIRPNPQPGLHFPP